MSLSEKRKFTFTWQIQNFSMCPQKLGDCLTSPVFVVDKMKESEWCMDFYPKGNRDEGSVTCYLRCCGVGNYTGAIKIDFNLALFSSDIEERQKEYIENHTFKLDTRIGYNNFVKRYLIFDNKDAYLPSDTLTVKCSLWGTDTSDSEKDQFPDHLKKEIFATASVDYAEDSRIFNGCSVVTRVEVQRKTVSWPIRSFSSISPNKRITVLVHSSLKDVPSFCLTLYKSSDDRWAEIEIRSLKTKSMKQTFVKCKISVIYALKSVGCFAVDEHLIVPDVDRVWKFPQFLQLSKLREIKYLDRTYDVLHLRFEFAFSQLADVHHIKKDSSKNKFEFFKYVCHPIDEFGQLYRDGELSDMTVRAGDREFKVHKIILKARSPVFSAMFDCDMKEKLNGVVDITDVDPETMDRLFGFMYTNAVEDVQMVDAIKLYSAAAKYEVQLLKERCTEVLVSTLLISNVCEVLCLADLHHDEYLHESAQCFIHANSVQIFNSLEWKDFIKSHGTLAAKVMHKMLTN